MGDEFQDVSVDKPIQLTLEATWINPNLGAIFGFDGSKSSDAATYAMVIDTTDVVSGGPAYPNLPDLEGVPWWHIRRRWHINAEREYLIRCWEQDYRAWEADGKPDREVVVRRYFPSVRITHGD